MITPDSISCRGYCSRCECQHSLPFGRALEKARDLQNELKRLKRLDYLAGRNEADPRYSVKRLLPGDRGHMFAVMECLDASGEIVWLRAFSSLGTGVREIPGWVPPILRTEVFNQIVLPKQAEIKRLTRQIDEMEVTDPNHQRLKQERKAISQQLMPRIHDLYRFHNFRGEEKPLREVFLSETIPGGVGDCCAPKLINHAAKTGLKPISVAEFFWGGQNKSGRKQPGDFFAACEEKCQPILGFLLCGLEQDW